MIPLLIALTVSLAAALAVTLAAMHRQQARHTTDLNDAHKLPLALAGHLEREHKAHRAEVQTLLQRIQAPQVAVGQHIDATTPTQAATYPLDEDEQAQAQDWQLAAAATLEQIRAHEAEIKAGL